jgi:AraC-like DNA-binding protein
MTKDQQVHADQVQAVALGNAEADDGITDSWKRSAATYHVDPASNEAPRVLTAGEVKDRRGPLENLIVNAREEIDGLYRLVGGAGYVVLLCDANGAAIDHRGNPAHADEFKYWGTWLGGIWAENAEGTNGIGTAITERRPVTVHRSQHFRSRHIDLSCSGAPIFADGGELLGVIDVSAIDPMLSEHAHALTGVLTEKTALAIEERLFREAFRDSWVLAIVPADQPGDRWLLAVDSDHRVLGADRAARSGLRLSESELRTGASLWRYFQRDPTVFAGDDCADLARRLVPIGQSEGWFALVTPPLRAAAFRVNGAGLLHTRPRQTLFGAPHTGAQMPESGGLSASALRRVRAYVESNLDRSIDVAKLAEVAGLSVFHFSRSFKDSTGMTPHAFVVARRIERARKLLAETGLPLAEIAAKTGFSDQGHLARQFRKINGTTPRAYRASVQ